jgi:cytochrome b561
MQILSSPTLYGAIAQSCCGCVGYLGVGFGVSDDLLPRGSGRATGLYIHITAGLLVIVLAVMRLLYRTADSSPSAANTEFGNGSLAGWMGLGAKLAHLGLYLLLVAVPLVGIAVQFARGNPPAGVRIVRHCLALVRRSRFRAQSERYPRIACAWPLGFGRPTCRGGASASLGF